MVRITYSNPFSAAFTTNRRRTSHSGNLSIVSALQTTPRYSFANR
jgi:hypothetical protein